MTRDRITQSRAFTLLELLVTLSIVALLTALLIPSISGVVSTARGNRCMMHQRTIINDFILFADSELHPRRGDDERRWNNRFLLSTFVERAYAMDEFWPSEYAQPWRELPRSGDYQHLQCPSYHPDPPLRVSRQDSAFRSGFQPGHAVSYGFNFRLYRRDQLLFGLDQFHVLSPRILHEPNVPLVMDVHWTEANSVGILDTAFVAPPLDDPGPFLANERYWPPGFRHGGAMTVGFIDGHVVSTERPLSEPGWRWDFEPR
ncbi:MAG: type II secretion system protein [Phycisphaerales bacterium]